MKRIQRDFDPLLVCTVHPMHSIPIHTKRIQRDFYPLCQLVCAVHPLHSIPYSLSFLFKPLNLCYAVVEFLDSEHLELRSVVLIAGVLHLLH